MASSDETWNRLLCKVQQCCPSREAVRAKILINIQHPHPGFSLCHLVDSSFYHFTIHLFRLVMNCIPKQTRRIWGATISGSQNAASSWLNWISQWNSHDITLDNVPGMLVMKQKSSFRSQPSTAEMFSSSFRTSPSSAWSSSDDYRCSHANVANKHCQSFNYDGTRCRWVEVEDRPPKFNLKAFIFCASPCLMIYWFDVLIVDRNSDVGFIIRPAEIKFYK